MVSELLKEVSCWSYFFLSQELLFLLQLPFSKKKKMSSKKNRPATSKSKLHPRSKHRQRYDLQQLVNSYPKLEAFLKVNKFNDQSIDFSDPQAVKALNTALLKHHYGIQDWGIPAGYLCPPIPGRMDYLHHLADLLASSNKNKIPRGQAIVGFDIGVGANGIYPLLGAVEYGWSFIGSEIDQVAVQCINTILDANHKLRKKIEVRQQANANKYFQDILKEGEVIDFSICNPPFHANKAAADQSNQRKQSHLQGKKVKTTKLNFGGQAKELWTAGGELRFVRDMIYESRTFATQCFWFTSLVSKEAYLEEHQKTLKRAKVTDSRVIPMGQGNKKSRILAWTFLTPKQQKVWSELRWK